MGTTDRFRRPAQHEDLLNELQGKEGPFRNLVEAMMFAAALGQRKNRREEFDKTGEPIRLALMDGRQYGDVLIDMLAAVKVQDDPKILADDRLDERVRIFEEYANGGLSYLRGELNTAPTRDLDVLVGNLVMEALTTPQDQDDEVGAIMSSADLDW
ncbi:DNA phosphorothioation-associated protein 4 [Streptomyces sp. RLB3-6]|uniref:DNA phosphorothioation-associated protein 4 n=1 Tax=Streptomyces sp. RLB3-6 TaxID=2594457 RepID=UPI001162DEDD|nr:DNA phosphorothioation-associated protein 4 [Streptomyces sp. RLB3-6]QDN93544.1 DNA phosphorothioation-associated protein 4 [Streptomyces sp. RLB3-6]